MTTTRTGLCIICFWLGIYKVWETQTWSWTHFTRALSKDQALSTGPHPLGATGTPQKPLTMSYSLRSVCCKRNFCAWQSWMHIFKTGPSPLYLHREGYPIGFKHLALVLPLVASDLDLCLLFVHTVTALPGVVLYSLLVFILDQESFMGHFSKRA